MRVTYQVFHMYVQFVLQSNYVNKLLKSVCSNNKIDNKKKLSTRPMIYIHYEVLLFAQT